MELGQQGLQEVADRLASEVAVVDDCLGTLEVVEVGQEQLQAVQVVAHIEAACLVVEVADHTLEVAGHIAFVFVA